MTISKQKQTHNNMSLFMLASLACGQDDSRSSTTSTENQRMPSVIAAVSDMSDDDASTIEAVSPAKELVVARRRRRPLKKRIPASDYRTASSSLQFLGSSINSRKSLLETSINIICNNPTKSKRDMPARVESRDEQRVPAPEQEENNTNDDSPEADEEIPTLVSDDEAWKNIHSPLFLPSYLPCPATALKDVKSICLTLKER